MSHLTSKWNSAVSHLEMLRGEALLGSGTCFFWNNLNQIFLVTNWHNLTGRNPLTNEARNIPDRVRVWVYKRISEPDQDGFYEMNYVPLEIIICDEHLNSPRWLEHPNFGRRVDIGVINISREVTGYDIECVNKLETDALIAPRTSQDVFIVGFPFGHLTGVPAPVWKRGTIAVEPDFDVDNLPKMLVDTATREGMSGSVAIARHIITGTDFKRKDGTRSEKMIYATLDVVVGIYSGRHYPDLEKAQLGIVWKRRAIEETIAQGRAPVI